MKQRRAKLMRGTLSLVQEILENDLESRSSDDRLYAELVKRKNALASQMPFDYVIRRLTTFNLPPYDTVSRCRRKLQRQYPELSADPETEAARMIMEEEFREWAIND